MISGNVLEREKIQREINECDSMYSQSFLLGDVKGGCHVDEGGKAVQVVTVGMRKDGVCLNIKEAGRGKSKDAFHFKF